MTKRPGATLVALLLLLALAASAAIAYSPALRGGFLNWDDPETVVGNPYVTDPGLDGALHILTGRVFAAWLPVYYLSLWLDHLLFGLSPLGFHAVNLLLHVLSALVVLAVARRITGSRAVGWGAAFLFALHPAAVGSVAWISERKGLLAFLLSGLSFLAFLAATGRTGRGRWLRHGAGASLLALALLAKGSALAVPILLLLYVAALRWKERRARWALDLAPYAVVAAALAAVHFSIAVDEGTAVAGPGPGVGALLLTDVGLLGRYLRILFLPFWGLSAVHATPIETGLSLRLLLGAGALALLVFALVLAWRRDRVAFFALAAAVGALAPFNNLFPRTTVLFAERYLYLSLFGTALLVARVMERLARRAPPAVLPVALAVGAAILLPFARGRAAVWENPVRLFADAEAKAPGSWLAAMKHAEALADRARAGETECWARAAEVFGRAVERADDPLSRARARADLSGVLLALPPAGEEEQKERLEGVLHLIEEAREDVAELGPEPREKLTFHLEVNRGSTLAALSRPAKAAEAYRTAARLSPEDPAPLTAMVGVLLAAGKTEEALEAGREAVRLDPANETSAVVLGQAEIAAGDAVAARKTLEGLLEKSPESPSALTFLGKIELASSRPRAARERFAAALAIQGGLRSAEEGMAEADLLLARSLYAEGKREEAVSVARRALGEDPENARTLLFLGAITPDAAEADRLLSRASGMPEGDRARNLLATHRLTQALVAIDEGGEAEAASLVARAIEARPERLAGSGELSIRADLPRLTELAGADDAAGRRDALVGLAMALGGRLPAAMARFSAVLRAAQRAGEFEGPAVWTALYARGAARIEAGEPKRAADDFGILLESDPKDPRAALGRAVARFHLASARQAEEAGRDPEELYGPALAASEEALALDPGDLRALLTRGEIEFAMGHHVESLKTFNRAKREHPGRVEPMMDLADLYRIHYQLTGEKSYLREARNELFAAVELAPHDAKARAAYGRILVELGEAAEASRQLSMAISEDPTRMDAREALADLYVRAARAQLEQGGVEGRDRARDLAERALALEVRSAGPHLVLAEIARSERDFAPAQVHLEHALVLEPDRPEVKDAAAAFYRDLGYALLLRGKREKAEEAFRRALAAGSATVDLSQVRLILEGQPAGPEEEPADPELERLLAEKREEARVAFDEAGAKLAAEDLDGAAAAAARSIAAYETGEAWYRLGRIREAQKRKPDAVQAYRNAVRRKPSLAEAWLALGSVLYFEGELADSLSAWETFLKIAGDDVPDSTRTRIEEMVKELRRKLDEKDG